MGNIWRSRMSRRRLQGKIEQRTSYSKLNWSGTKQFAPLFFAGRREDKGMIRALV